MNACKDCQTALPMDATQQIDIATGQAQCIPCCLACPPGTEHSDGIRHSAKVAWRALANLQKELEAAQ